MRLGVVDSSSSSDHPRDSNEEETLPLLWRARALTSQQLPTHHHHHDGSSRSYSCHSMAVVVMLLVVAAVMMVVLPSQGGPMGTTMDLVTVPGVYYEEPPAQTDLPDASVVTVKTATDTTANENAAEQETATATDQANQETTTTNPDGAEPPANDAATAADQAQAAAPSLPVPIPPLVVTATTTPSPTASTPVTPLEDTATAQDEAEDEQPAEQDAAEDEPEQPEEQDEEPTEPASSSAPVATTTQPPSPVPTTLAPTTLAPTTLPKQQQETFSDLALRLLPTYYQAMLATLNGLAPDVPPGQVYLPRKAILKLRDLVDVFGPIYPNQTMTKTTTNMTTTATNRHTHQDKRNEQEENERYDHHKHHSLDASPRHRNREKEENRRHDDDHHRRRHHHHDHDHRALSKHHHHHADKDKKKDKDHSHPKEKHEDHDHHDSHHEEHQRHDDDDDATNHHVDPWWEFRHWLDQGYEIIGNFLDLDHSHVKYTVQMEHEQRQKVLDWHHDFLHYIATHDVLALLQPEHFGTYRHAKESHLVWGSMHDTRRPKPDDAADACLRRLMQQQAMSANQYLDVSLEFHSVLEEKRHEEYHNLRKILRSMVDEYEMMGAVMDPYGTLATEMTVLKQARTSLGDLNDDYTAWSIYDSNSWYHRRKSDLNDSIHSQWLDFKEWAVKKGGLKDSLNMLNRKLSDESHLSMMGLADFLTSVQYRPTHHLVIGNGAGDADSIISALTLAYIESMSTSVIMTPIVSIPRRALEKQRPEVTLLLQLAEISTASLICVDDYLMLQRDMSDYDVTLVDHNAIESTFETAGWTVTEIVDHHVDQGYYRSTCSGANRTVAFADGKPTVVSTCVLVAERMKELLPLPYPAPVGLLLLGVILLDSVNLSTEARQVSLRDEDAVRDLVMNTDWRVLSLETRKRLGLTKRPRPNPTVVFEVLQSARYDPRFWDSLSVAEALDYDFKEYSSSSGTFGVSTILMPLDCFVAKPGLDANIKFFMDDIGTDFLAIMLASDESAGKQRRQLILCGTRHFELADLVDYLVNDRHSEEPLRLIEITNVDHHDAIDDLEMRFFEQGNVLSSRKQIGPILLQFFDEALQS